MFPESAADMSQIFLSRLTLSYWLLSFTVSGIAFAVSEMIFDNLVVNLFRFRPARDRDRHRLFCRRAPYISFCFCWVTGGNETILKYRMSLRYPLLCGSGIRFGNTSASAEISQSIEGFDSGSE